MKMFDCFCLLKQKKGEKKIKTKHFERLPHKAKNPLRSHSKDT